MSGWPRLYYKKYIVIEFFDITSYSLLAWYKLNRPDVKFVVGDKEMTASEVDISTLGATTDVKIADTAMTLYDNPNYGDPKMILDTRVPTYPGGATMSINVVATLVQGGTAIQPTVHIRSFNPPDFAVAAIRIRMGYVGTTKYIAGKPVGEWSCMAPVFTARQESTGPNAEYVLYCIGVGTEPELRPGFTGLGIQVPYTPNKTTLAEFMEDFKDTVFANITNVSIYYDDSVASWAKTLPFSKTATSQTPFKCVANDTMIQALNTEIQRFNKENGLGKKESRPELYLTITTNVDNLAEPSTVIGIRALQKPVAFNQTLVNTARDILGIYRGGISVAEGIITVKAFFDPTLYQGSFVLLPFDTIRGIYASEIILFGLRGVDDLYQVIMSDIKFGSADSTNEMTCTLVGCTQAIAENTMSLLAETENYGLGKSYAKPAPTAPPTAMDVEESKPQQIIQKGSSVASNQAISWLSYFTNGTPAQLTALAGGIKPGKWQDVINIDGLEKPAAVANVKALTGRWITLTKKSLKFMTILGGLTNFNTYYTNPTNGEINTDRWDKIHATTPYKVDLTALVGGGVHDWLYQVVYSFIRAFIEDGNYVYAPNKDYFTKEVLEHMVSSIFGLRDIIIDLYILEEAMGAGNWENIKFTYLDVLEPIKKPWGGVWG